MLGRALRRLLPVERQLELRHLGDRLAARRLAGERFECPVCEGRFDVLLPYGRPPRSRARCPRCGAFERHRLLWLYLRRRTDFFTARLAVLDVAPVWYIQHRCRRLPNLDYLSVDLESPVAMRHMDLTALALPDRSFDCILCIHVLEHVADEARALAELQRVLKPGGWALLQVPLDGRLEHTREDPAVCDPVERRRRFGHPDHLRRYGRDYPERLRRAGFAVTADDWAASLPAEQARRWAVPRSQIIYRCRRPE